MRKDTRIPSLTGSFLCSLQLSKNMDQFKTKLESFAAKHKNSIKKDPEFRERFQEMCATIGVDPLASSKGEIY
jgi:ESCRT-II complex subunit VPS22